MVPDIKKFKRAWQCPKMLTEAMRLQYRCSCRKKRDNEANFNSTLYGRINTLQRTGDADLRF